MCMLCSEIHQEVVAERKHKRTIADALRRLAAEYEALADGRRKPHTEEWQRNKSTAVWLLRELVEWA